MANKRSSHQNGPNAIQSEVGPVPTGRRLDLAGRNWAYSIAAVSFLLDRQIDQSRCVVADQLKFFAVVGAGFFFLDTRP